MAVLEDSGMGELLLARVSDARGWGMEAECVGGDVTLDAWSGSRSMGGEDKGKVGWRMGELESCTAVVGDVEDGFSAW